MNTANKISPSDLLAMQFLEHAKQFNANSELIKVLKSITYSIGEANVLVRAASEGNRRYFFGLNYLTVEEIANLDNPFISFICGSIEKIIIIPAFSVIVGYILYLSLFIIFTIQYYILILSNSSR